MAKAIPKELFITKVNIFGQEHILNPPVKIWAGEQIFVNKNPVSISKTRFLEGKSMEMIPVASSLIDSIGYDEEAKKLYVKFHSGPSYVYEGVSLELYGEMLQSPSPGKFFHRQIRGRFEGEKLS